jgi:hypothetical protein
MSPQGKSKKDDFGRARSFSIATGANGPAGGAPANPASALKLAKKNSFSKK